MRAPLFALPPSLPSLPSLPCALALLAVLCGAPALAQSPATVAAAPGPEAAAPAKPRADKRIERLHTEDAGSRVDEVRYGGETQSTTVNTKSGLPEYEIVPANGARNRPQGERDAASGSSGQRVWKLLDF